MASHRAQAQFARSRWRLLILAPLWTVQYALTFGLIGLFAYRLSDSMIHYEQRDKLKGLWPIMEIVWECANIGLSVVMIICTGVEIAKYIGEALTPWIMVFTHVTKLCCASAILALGIVIHIKGIDKLFSIIGLVLSGLLLATAILLTIYVFIAYRRLVTFDDHPHTANAKSYGFSDGMDRRSSYTAMLGSIRPSMEKRVSSASSYLSLRRPSAENTAATTTTTMTPLSEFERIPGPYSHERDTQFDDYVSRRHLSTGSHGGHPDVESALSAEFDWDHSPMRTASKLRGLSPESEGAGRVRSGSGSSDRLVAVGSVMSRPRGASMPRAPSWQSDHGLVSVPEEEDAGDARTRDQRDRQALLGGSKHGRRRSDDEEVVPQDVDLVEPRWQSR